MNKKNIKVLIYYREGKFVEEKIKSAYPDLTVKLWTGRKDADDFIEEAEVVICWLLPDELLKRAGNLKLIQIIGTGCEHILTLPSFKKDIMVATAKGVNNIPISEYVMCYMLSVCQKTFLFMDFQKKREWGRAKRFELNGKILGLIGLGGIGKEIARKAKAFDMKVMGVKRRPEPVDNVDEVYGNEGLEEVFKRSDFVVLSLPVTTNTRNLIGKKEIDSMKSSAYLINIARGELLDEEYLSEAVKNGKIAGAVLDVFKDEPLKSENSLWNIDNLILTPHISWTGDNTFERIGNVIVDNIGRYIRGEELQFRIDPDIGY